MLFSSFQISFWISLYFLCLLSDDDAMETFKRLRRKHRKQLSMKFEILPYFAFELIGDPQKHPNFQHLFSMEWKAELLDRLDKFLENLPEHETQPELTILVQEKTKTVSTTLCLDTKSCPENYNNDENSVHSLTDTLGCLSGESPKIITDNIQWESPTNATSQSSSVSSQISYVDFLTLTDDLQV